jgi:hypothetical protein
MSEKSKSALRTSMKEFKDISGIVWNVQTGNLVSGNHRWEHLVEDYGLDNIELVRINDADDYFMIMGMGEFTGYLMREVDWDEDTEKAANIAANSDKLKGEFTNAVGEILESISDSNSRLPKSIFKDLRFEGLKLEYGEGTVDFADYKQPKDFNFDDDFDLEDTDEDVDLSELDTEVSNITIEDTEDEVPSIEMTSLVIKCRLENRSDIIDKIRNCLIDYNDVTID